MRNGGTSAGLCGREIRSKKVGIIGCGQIGFMTAKLFQAFGAEVYAYARHEREEVKAAGIAYKPLDDLLRECDIISLHTPNTKETRGMISAEKIALMKKSAIFINCARGPIVDSKALAQALNEGRIAGAAVDVFDCEPPIPAEEPLLHAKNTLLTPHVASCRRKPWYAERRLSFPTCTLIWTESRKTSVRCDVERKQQTEHIFEFICTFQKNSAIICA